MTRLTLFFVASVLPFVTASCYPTFNWRDVHPDNTSLSALLPCKPDKGRRSVPLGGQATELAMVGCDTGGATFAIAVATVGDPSQAAPVLAQWQKLTLANMKAVPDSIQRVALTIPGQPVATPALRVSAQGRRADGTTVMGQAAYFTHGSQLFQVVLYAPTITPETAETFFSSLKFQ